MGLPIPLKTEYFTQFTLRGMVSYPAELFVLAEITVDLRKEVPMV